MATIETIRKAFNEGRVFHVRVHQDGSGVEIEWKNPTGDHGLPCRMLSSFNIEEGIKILSGININIKKS